MLKCIHCASDVDLILILFRYNTLGQLVCVVCNSNVKNEKLWNAHLLSRTHKEVRCIVNVILADLDFRPNKTNFFKCIFFRILINNRHFSVHFLILTLCFAKYINYAIKNIIEMLVLSFEKFFAFVVYHLMNYLNVAMPVVENMF